MKNFILTLVSLSLLAPAASFSQDRFPESPNSKVTPGEVCATGNTRRYPEKILYCSRSVGSSVKKQIIINYDKQFGYQIEEMERTQFKIDHYIPLCMGGSNNVANLWPQHESVFRYTDDLERLTCEAMSSGKLKQAEAIRVIKAAKADPVNAYKYLDYLEKL